MTSARVSSPSKLSKVDSKASPEKEEAQSPATTSEITPMKTTPSIMAPSAIKNPDGSGGNVKGFCRFRPLNSRELSTTENEVCVTFKNETTCAVMGINARTG